MYLQFECYVHVLIITAPYAVLSLPSPSFPSFRNTPKGQDSMTVTRYSVSITAEIQTVKVRTVIVEGTNLLMPILKMDPEGNTYDSVDVSVANVYNIAVQVVHALPPTGLWRSILNVPVLRSP